MAPAGTDRDAAGYWTRRKGETGGQVAVSVAGSRCLLNLLGTQLSGIGLSDATALAVSQKSRTAGESTSVRHAIDSIVGGMSVTGMNARPGRSSKRWVDACETSQRRA